MKNRSGGDESKLQTQVARPLLRPLLTHDLNISLVPEALRRSDAENIRFISLNEQPDCEREIGEEGRISKMARERCALDEWGPSQWTRSSLLSGHHYR